MNKKVLIADDYEDNVVLLSEIISYLNYETHYVEDGGAVLEAMKSDDFCLIFMDIEMPVMNGFEASEEIRSTLPEPKCNVPIIAISAHSHEFFEEKLKKSGINEYIPKPYSIDKITDIFNRYGI